MSAQGSRRFPGRAFLRAYLRVGILISLIVVAVGLSTLLSATLSAIFGYGFSYYPGASPDPRTLDWVNGTTTTLVGLIFLGVHIWGSRAAEAREERANSELSRLTAAAGAIVFGLVAIIGLVTGISAALTQIFVRGSQNQPGPPLAAGIIFGAGWAWFVAGVFQHLRRDQPPPPGEEATSPAEAPAT